MIFHVTEGTALMVVVGFAQLSCPVHGKSLNPRLCACCTVAASQKAVSCPGSLLSSSSFVPQMLLMETVAMEERAVRLAPRPPARGIIHCHQDLALPRETKVQYPS